MIVLCIDNIAKDERTDIFGPFIAGNSCGPSGNVFSRDTVSLQANTDTNKDELKLEFKKVGNNWEASEVRVLLPQAEMPYHYGNYSFSIKSVNVIDSSTGTVLDNALPVTMILGLFTWDATEDYAIHENYNHEVDIEIAQWNIPGQADIQYLVQPPGEPHKYRFYSGEGNTYNQAPHTYSFDWRPAEIEWNSDAGGGQSFTLTTQDALDAGKPDYIQCMPADVEVRLNLWHLFGDSQPSGLQDSHIVEVVIDDFQFTPNGLTALVDGSTCSKDCHCGPDSTCQNNRCTYVSPGANAEFRPSRSQSSSTVTNPPTADSTIFTNPPTDDSGSDQIIPVPSTPEADGDAGTGEVIISVEGNNTNSVGEDSTEDNVIASSFKAGDNGGSNRGGMKAGVSLLFIALTVAALVVNIRRRRDSASQSKMNDMISSNGLNKNVVVDTTVSDEETDKEASFEISVKEEDDSSILQRTLNQCLGSIKL